MRRDGACTGRTTIRYGFVAAISARQSGSVILRGRFTQEWLGSASDSVPTMPAEVWAFLPSSLQRQWAPLRRQRGKSDDPASEKPLIRGDKSSISSGNFSPLIFSEARGRANAAIPISRGTAMVAGLSPTCLPSKNSPSASAIALPIRPRHNCALANLLQRTVRTWFLFGINRIANTPSLARAGECAGSGERRGFDARLGGRLACGCGSHPAGNGGSVSAAFGFFHDRRRGFHRPAGELGGMCRRLWTRHPS